MFLTIETIPFYNKIIIIPCDLITKREDPDHEFVFDTEEQAAEFCRQWFQDPVLACRLFKYQEAIDIAENAA